MITGFRTLCDVPQEAAKHQRMDRNNRVPVEAAEQAARIEGGRLPDPRASPPIDRGHLELQPASTRQLHVRGKTRQSIGLVGDDCPAVDNVADDAAVLIAPPAIHAGSPEQPIKPATYLPQAIAEVPATGA